MTSNPNTLRSKFKYIPGGNYKCFITLYTMDTRIIKFHHPPFLLKYKGLKGENPYSHLATFEIVCSTINEALGLDAYRIRLFPFSLEGDVVIWLGTLELNSIATWNLMRYAFINNCFPPKLSINIQ